MRIGSRGPVGGVRVCDDHVAQRVHRTTWTQTHWRLLVGVALLGCSDRQPMADPTHGVIDDLGRAVDLAQPAQRIVSLSPMLTELVFAIGAGDRLVGRTPWAQYPPEALDVADIGDALDPSVESIVARTPDLVIMYASDANTNALSQLDALGIPTANFHADSLASVAPIARRLGVLTGTVDRADRVATEFEHRLNILRSTILQNDTVSVVILTWDNPPIVIGGGSFLSEIVALAGGRNVFDDVEAPSLTVTVETIVARRPDVVLLPQESGEGFSQRPEWQVVESVRDRRFVGLGGSEFSWPSVRVFEAIERLRQSLDSLRR